MPQPQDRAGKPPRVRVDLRIAPEGLDLVKQLAEREQRSLSDTLRILIMEALTARGLLEPPKRGRKRS